MTWSIPKAMMTATTLVTGAGPSMTKVIKRVCWTTFASESVRVIIEPVPKHAKSEPESSRLCSYTAVRRSRPTFAASREASL